jgi:6,7-dimethyl-8-ribityllumazine synthase
MPEIKIIYGKDDFKDTTIGIVASRYNSHIVGRLLSACIDKLVSSGLSEQNIIIVHVPGAFEIPIAVQQLILKHECEAVITLGVIIRGETPHFEYIARECSHGIAKLALKYEVPVIFGVLTVDNTEQAMQRSGSEESNKGAESAHAAIQMISLLRRI